MPEFLEIRTNIFLFKQQKLKKQSWRSKNEYPTTDHSSNSNPRKVRSRLHFHLIYFTRYPFTIYSWNPFYNAFQIHNKRLNESNNLGEFRVLGHPSLPAPSWPIQRQKREIKWSFLVFLLLKNWKVWWVPNIEKVLVGHTKSHPMRHHFQPLDDQHRTTTYIWLRVAL